MFENFARSFAACAALALPATPSFAEVSRDVVQVEVLDGGETAHGTVMTALRLTLADGWKTYWRAPGDAGIPPSFNWRGSRNVGEVAITWPTPQVFNDYGMRSIGYLEQLVLPIEITPSAPGRPVRLKGRMELGVCHDVCIPSELRFDHSVDAGADRNPVIAAALANRPYSASEAGVQSATCTIRPTEGGLLIEARIVMPSAGGIENAVIEPGNPEIWASEPEVSRQGNTLIAASSLVHVNKEAYALDRSRVRITVLGDDHAVDIKGCAPA